MKLTEDSYSPLGRGVLTGQLKSRADFPEGDLRLHMPRFSEENFPLNLKLVEQLQDLAKAKGVESSQLAIACKSIHHQVSSL